MGHPLPDENFESGSRHPNRAPSPDPARPDWLTRANDHSERTPAAPGPGARQVPEAPRSRPAKPVQPPAGAEPHRPTSWTPAPGGVQKLETDTILSAHVPHHGPAGVEPGSWEGTVKQVARTAKLAGGSPQGGGSGTRRAPAAGASGFGRALALLSSPRVMLILVVAVIVMAVIALRPKGVDQTDRISAIRHHPERFDGKSVKIKGRVGEVFMVGGGYAFYLHQGRDTMVVFTRSRIPVRREEVTIAGSISNGMLDGRSRQALFEATR